MRGTQRTEDVVRTALLGAAELIKRQEPLSEVVSGVCERLADAVEAREVTIALGDAATGAIRYRFIDGALYEREDPLDDPVAIAIVAGGRARSVEGPVRTAVYAPLREEQRTIGAVWVTSDPPAHAEHAVAMVEAFGAYLSLAFQRARLRERARALEALTIIDPLTGVPNRRAFSSALEREWARGARSKLPLGMAILDIDNFKLYNDTYGHAEGDTCLKLVAQACHGKVWRAGDVFARYGGEEFGIILPEADSRAALIVAERVRRAVEELEIPHAHNQAGIVTVSVGVASLVPHHEHEPRVLVEQADAGLYRAKGSGRNCVINVDLAQAS